ncbi:ubiquitin thioesterase OTU1-like [Mya arenaria]|uniref:ubiquitin thioesterase OTU1-like n=1 Tax=Mya arenaria TaxID=6604 RepID=UPI0022E2E454|nr:ubiquitin thioesterase OTU1-like [Mya arenaria]
MSLNLRCKSKAGQHYLKDLNATSTVSVLMDRLHELTHIPRDCIKVKQGYPPKVIDLSKESDELSTLPFQSGDTLIVEEDVSLRKKRQQNVDNVLQDQISTCSGMLMRKVVPADNCCLFTSIDCVTNHGKVDLSSSTQMRELIAGVVMSDPVTYDTAMLGKSNSDYCKWIMKADSWGGAIEISILTKYYGIEIDVVDTQTGRIDKFGEDQDYKERVLLIYDGIHYDPLVLEPLVPGDAIHTVFKTNDANILSQAIEIGNEAKQARQFTDVGNFTLRCLICQLSLRGEKEAQSHAKSTGHINFGEY